MELLGGVLACVELADGVRNDGLLFLFGPWQTSRLLWRDEVQSNLPGNQLNL